MPSGVACIPHLHCMACIELLNIPQRVSKLRLVAATGPDAVPVLIQVLPVVLPLQVSPKAVRIAACH